MDKFRKNVDGDIDMKGTETIKEIENNENGLPNYIIILLGAVIGIIPWLIMYHLYSYNSPAGPTLMPFCSMLLYIASR